MTAPAKQEKMNTSVHYMSNSALTKEINNCKYTYCEMDDKKYEHYDYIIDSTTHDFFGDIEYKETLKDKTKVIKNDTIINRAIYFHCRRNKGVKPEQVNVLDLVFRVMTDEHIPRDEKGKRAKLNFPAFKHYIITDVENQVVKEVGRSHFKNGDFSIHHGKISDKLARMYMLMVTKYGSRYNWRGYSYIDDMKSQALLQLSQVGLMFNEAKNQALPNPFAYYTTTITRCFTKVLKDEKKISAIKDKILLDSDRDPSNAKQLEIETAYRKRYSPDIDSE